MRQRNQGNVDTSCGQAGYRLCLAQGARLAIAGLALAGGAALAQTSAQTAAPAADSTRRSSAGWQACTNLSTDSTARLACFDAWSQGQQGGAVPAPLASTTPPLASVAPPVALPPAPEIAVTVDKGCHAGQYSNLSRFWELEGGSDCGVFGIRGYRPMSLSVVFSSGVNKQPTSPAAGHTAATSTPYSTTENRIQLSVRTKIIQGLLTQADSPRKDSLWFGYTQQSYWQLFSGAISRPFRATDHEPELIYVYPTDLNLPAGWRLRYSGVGVVHQSNGQSLPLSRSWNRVYLMAGMEHDNKFSVQARVWKRLHEDPASDDNPDISDYIGRGEVAGYWNYNKDNTFGVTVRHSLRADRNGSVRFEWLKALGNTADTADGTRASGLRLHTQLFSGYGDSMIDYNRRRTVLSVGLSLVDF